MCYRVNILWKLLSKRKIICIIMLGVSLVKKHAINNYGHTETHSTAAEKSPQGRQLN